MNHEIRACARPESVMNLAIFISLIQLPLVFSLDPSDVLARRSASCQRPGKFDEARFALQWSPGICYNIINKVCLVNVDKFTIHGLWPSKIGGNDPQNCCNKPFDAKLIKHLEPKLKVSSYMMKEYNILNISSFIHSFIHSFKCHTNPGNLDHNIYR